MPNQTHEYSVAKISLWLQNSIAIVGAVAITIVMPFIKFDETNQFDKVWFAFFFSGWLYLTYSFLKMPYQVNLSELEKMLYFKSIFGVKLVGVQDISRIKVNINGTYIEFKHTSGRIQMINRIQDIHNLITDIKRLNEKVQTIGC